MAGVVLLAAADSRPISLSIRTGNHSQIRHCFIPPALGAIVEIDYYGVVSFIATRNGLHAISFA